MKTNNKITYRLSKYINNFKKKIKTIQKRTNSTTTGLKPNHGDETGYAAVLKRDERIGKAYARKRDANTRLFSRASLSPDAARRRRRRIKNLLTTVNTTDFNYLNFHAIKWSFPNARG